ncbi:MAG: NMD3-related protein [Candidatus Bilamarchaeaceae archaeon]
MKLICPSCGASNEEVRFSGPFCMRCKPVHISLPKKVEYQICPRCGRMRFKGNWIEFSEAKIEEDVASKCRGEFLRATYSLKEQRATFFVGDRKEMHRLEMPLAVGLVKALCPDCSRKSSGYFEAIIQLRGKPSSVKRYARLFKKILSRKTFISKEEERKEGADLYVGNSKELISLLREMGIRAHVSRKLAGQREGKRLYRTTFLIRFSK